MIETLKKYGNKEFVINSKSKKIVCFIFTTIVMFTYAFTGFKKPWSYGYFNYTIGWQYGYIPRGFTATFLNFILGENSRSYVFLTFIQYFLIWFFLAYLIYITYKIILKNGDMLGMFFLLLFFTSPFCVFYPAQIGFLDHIIYIFAVLHIEICLKCKCNVCIISGGIFSFLTILVLETGAFIICPVIASVTFLRMLDDETEKIGKKIIKMIAAFIPTFILIILTRNKIASPETVNNYINAMQEYSYYDDSFKGLISFFDGTIVTYSPHKWIYVSPQIIIYSLVFVFFALQAMYYNNPNKTLTIIFSSGLTLLSALVALGPMFFGGSDFHRYYFSCGMSAFLISLYILRKQKKIVKAKYAVIPIVVSIICFLLISSYRLWNWNGYYNNFWFEKLF